MAGKVSQDWADEKALEIVSQFGWSSNVMRGGRLIGKQYIVAEAIAKALRDERREAYERGATDMRERAAKRAELHGKIVSSEHVGKACSRNIATEIRDITIPEPK